MRRKVLMRRGFCDTLAERLWSTLELRPALFEKGSDTFLCVLMHEQEWKAIDRVPHLIATETAVVKRFCHLHRKLWF